MTNFSNYCCLVILLFFVINTCKTDELTTNDLEFHVDSGLDDGIFDLAVKLDQKVCELPIDEGDCKDRSLSTAEDSENTTINSNELLELKKLEDLKELNELNELGGSDEDGESPTRYFGFNRITKQCEQFYYDGCGGNENRFESINECRKTCYTPLSYFLSKVQDQLMIRMSGASKLDK